MVTAATAPLPRRLAIGRVGGMSCDLNIIAGGYGVAGQPGADLRLGGGGASRNFRGRRARSAGGLGEVGGLLGQVLRLVAGSGGNAWVSRGLRGGVGMASLEWSEKSEAYQWLARIMAKPFRLCAAAAWGVVSAIAAAAPPGPPSGARPSPSMRPLPFFLIWIEPCSIADDARLEKSQCSNGQNGSGFDACLCAVSADREKRARGHDQALAWGRGHRMSVETCGLTARPVTLWGGRTHVN